MNIIIDETQHNLNNEIEKLEIELQRYENELKNLKQENKNLRLKLDNNDNINRFKCIECNQQFKNGKALGGHNAKIHSKKEKKT